MNENEFRKRLQDAIGQPPTMAPPVLSAGGVNPAHSPGRLVAIVAFVLAVVLVAVLVATRISFHPTANLLPASQPTPGATPQTARDSLLCALPVLATTDSGNPGQDGQIVYTAGFVNIPGGAFRVDPSADVGDLPAGSNGVSAPVTYSAQLKRWLPAGTQAISLDGRSYAYVTLDPPAATYRDFTSSELHVFDVSSHSDRKLWSFAGSIDIRSWTADGILADTVPPQGGVQLIWRIDPASGRAAQDPGAGDPSEFPVGGYQDYHSFSYMGGDLGTQRAVFRLGSRDPGTRYAVVLVDHGRITTIYSGVAGDAKRFDPAGVYFDAHGLWLGSADGSAIWLWTAAAGLESFTIDGAPAPAAGFQSSYLSIGPAGPCEPGTFAGVPASPLPAATSPSPTPPPPVIDWSTLQSKPLRLEQLPAGAVCPVSNTVNNLGVKAQNGKWPNYGFGAGPAYVSGQFAWYSAGSQAILILVDPAYHGPILVRVRRLDGTGSAELAGGGLQQLADGSVGLPQTSAPPYWGTAGGELTPSTAGCYGIQLDGTTFSEVVVIEVRQGPPPPG